MCQMLGVPSHFRNTVTPCTENISPKIDGQINLFFQFEGPKTNLSSISCTKNIITLYNKMKPFCALLLDIQVAFRS